MILAALDLPRVLDTKERRILFRGRDIPYWQKQIFQDIPFLSVEEVTPALSFLILFNPENYLHLSPAALREIFDHLEKQDPDIDQVWAFPGSSVLLSASLFLRELALVPSVGDIYPTFLNHPLVSPLHLKNRAESLDPTQNAIDIEAHIVDYQVLTLLSQGVIIEDFRHFYIEGFPPIGQGTSIGSGTVIKGDSRIGEQVTIYPHCFIENARIASRCIILPGCIIRDSILEEDTQIGPYTHLRSGAVVKKGAKMGNFVEMKNSVLGEESKSMHLTYIGDAQVGKKVNIGAGTITCNYDGKTKNRTVIEDNVFIGSGTELIAPVTVKRNSYVGAGSTITEDVPEDSLGIARQKQRNIIGWSLRKRKQ